MKNLIGKLIPWLTVLALLAAYGLAQSMDDAAPGQTQGGGNEQDGAVRS